MPHAVWIEMTAPESAELDSKGEQLPELIMSMIHAGWEVPEWRGANDDDSTSDRGAGEDEVPAVLDVRVLGFPGGALIGLAVETESLQIALSFGVSLGEHLADAAPALLGWVIESLNARKLTAPPSEGDWLPPLRENGPRFPVAEHLRSDLLELCAQFLLAAAVRDLHDPSGRSRLTPEAVDATDLVEGTVREFPWTRETPSELGTLLVAAGRFEEASRKRRPLVGRGGGDAVLAQRLLDAVRDEIVSPATGYDDDRMRGHVVVERFALDNDLRWNWHDGDLDGDAEDQRSQQQLRAVLWAGLRVLATLAHDLTEASRSPWLWLSGLGSSDVDDLVDLLAERDDERLADADEEDDDQLDEAADAHVLIRLAMLHPEHVGVVPEAASGPMHFVGFNALLFLGAQAVGSVTDHPSIGRLARPAHAALERIESGDLESDPYDDLHRLLERVLAASETVTRKPVEELLALVNAAAKAAGSEAAEEVARDLFAHPADLACVLLLGGEDSLTEERQRARILAVAAMVDPTVAGSFAADLPALRSDDPRDEPALRDQAAHRYSQLLEIVDSHPELAADLLSCPEPGARLFDESRPPAERLRDLSTAQAVVAVVQAIAVVSRALDDSDVAFNLLQ